MIDKLTWIADRTQLHYFFLLQDFTKSVPGKYGDVRFLISITVTVMDIKRLRVELLMKRLVPQGEGGALNEEVSTTG